MGIGAGISKDISAVADVELAESVNVRLSRTSLIDCACQFCTCAGLIDMVSFSDNGPVPLAVNDPAATPKLAPLLALIKLAALETAPELCPVVVLTCQLATTVVVAVALNSVCTGDTLAPVRPPTAAGIIKAISAFTVVVEAESPKVRRTSTFVNPCPCHDVTCAALTVKVSGKLKGPLPDAEMLPEALPKTAPVVG